MLLTTEEYIKLINAPKVAVDSLLPIIQELCTKVCDNMPVTWEGYGDRPVKPWGCILTDRREEITQLYCTYCDCCPVQTHCPYPSKQYSSSEHP